MKLEKLRKNIENFGLGAYLLYIVVKFINKAVYFKVLIGMTVTDKTLSTECLREADGFECRFLSSAEVMAFSKNSENDLPLEFLNRALANGDQCMAVLADSGELASYGWYAHKAAVFSQDLYLNFDNTYVYMYRGFTHPKYRGKRLHAIGMATALQNYTAQGAKGLISYVETSNFSSLKSVYRMGYVPFGKVYCLRVFNRYFVFRTGRCRDYKIELVERKSEEISQGPALKCKYS